MYSYTGVKIIHDQQIQEALEQQRLRAEAGTQRRNGRRAFGKLFARFASHSSRKTERTLPGCVECTVS